MVGEMESVVGAEFRLGADADAEQAWLRKCRRMFELTLKARPQEGWGQRKAESKHEIRIFSAADQAINNSGRGPGALHSFF
jgi:hypothetical protein